MERQEHGYARRRRTDAQSLRSPFSCLFPESWCAPWRSSGSLSITTLALILHVYIHRCLSNKGCGENDDGTSDNRLKMQSFQRAGAARARERWVSSSPVSQNVIAHIGLPVCAPLYLGENQGENCPRSPKFRELRRQTLGTSIKYFCFCSIGVPPRVLAQTSIESTTVTVNRARGEEAYCSEWRFEI